MKYELIKSEFNIKENLRLTFHQNITGEINKIKMKISNILTFLSATSVAQLEQVN